MCVLVCAFRINARGVAGFTESDYLTHTQRDTLQRLKQGERSLHK